MDGNRFSTSSNIYLQKILQYALIMYMYSFNDSFNVSLLLLLLFLVFMQARDEEKKSSANKVNTTTLDLNSIGIDGIHQM